MNNIIFYGYPKCSTCRKASKWLDHNNIDYQYIDIVKEPPTKDILELALLGFIPNKKKIFNTRGKSYKEKDFDIEKISNEKIIDLLSNDGKLIKRPLLIIKESKILIGFDESEYSQNLI